MVVRGTQHKLQTKQAITCAVMEVDENGNANKRSKKLLSKLLPHDNRDCTNDLLKQCISYLHDHQSGNSDAYLSRTTTTFFQNRFFTKIDENRIVVDWIAPAV